VIAPTRGIARHRPMFYGWVLTIGFVVGWLLQELGRRFLPVGAVKEFLTAGVTAQLGAITLNLGIITFGLGPLAIDVSLLSVVGVIVAYLIARSLF
jgi:hypothetical protein